MELLIPLVRKFNLTYTAFGETIIKGDSPSTGNITLQMTIHSGLESSPITLVGNPAYVFLSRTIKATYSSHCGFKAADTIIVAPGVMTGNTGRSRLTFIWREYNPMLTFTDTRHYWNLSFSPFRYNHLSFGEMRDGFNSIHTVNKCQSSSSLPQFSHFMTYSDTSWLFPGDDRIFHNPNSQLWWVNWNLGAATLQKAHLWSTWSNSSPSKIHEPCFSVKAFFMYSILATKCKWQADQQIRAQSEIAANCLDWHVKGGRSADRMVFYFTSYLDDEITVEVELRLSACFCLL